MSSFRFCQIILYSTCYTDIKFVRYFSLIFFLLSEKEDSLFFFLLNYHTVVFREVIF